MLSLFCFKEYYTQKMACAGKAVIQKNALEALNHSNN